MVVYYSCSIIVQELPGGVFENDCVMEIFNFLLMAVLLTIFRYEFIVRLGFLG